MTPEQAVAVLKKVLEEPGEHVGDDAEYGGEAWISEGLEAWIREGLEEALAIALRAQEGAE